MPVRHGRRRSERGASLLEAVCVVALGMVLLGSAIPWSTNSADTVQADSNMRVVLGQLTYAREAAINQRRSVQVRFVGTNLVQVIRQNLPSGTTMISSATLENAEIFVRFAGVPDTPDAFGGTTALSFGGATQMLFTADGRFTDQNGNPVNGSIFLGRPGHSTTARALTVDGLSARVRTYRWNGSRWTD